MAWWKLLLFSILKIMKEFTVQKTALRKDVADEKKELYKLVEYSYTELKSSDVAFSRKYRALFFCFKINYGVTYNKMCFFFHYTYFVLYLGKSSSIRFKTSSNRRVEPLAENTQLCNSTAR